MSLKFYMMLKVHQLMFKLEREGHEKLYNKI